jgi:hypothetical protein
MVRTLICATVLTVALALMTSWADAQPTQSSGLQSDAAFGTDAAGPHVANMDTALALGARSVRVFVTWKDTAPSPRSCTLPSAAALDDPNAYNFSQPATIIDTAHARGIAIYLAFNGPFPCYASLAPDAHCRQVPDGCTNRPNPQLYRKLVHAFAVRYGHLINRWSPYNEPDNSTFLTQTPTTPVIYRSLWFNARNEIRATTTTGAPLFFADVAGFPDAWVRTALCFSPTADDPPYPPCTSTPRAVDAEAIAFHPYLNRKPDDRPLTKNLQQITTAGTTLEAAQSRGLITTPSFTTITESGVHYHACYTNANVGGATHCDQGDGNPRDAGEIVGDLAASERRQAAWMNCVEQNAYNDRHVTGIVQYLLQDGPARNPDDVWYTGLRHEANPGQVGTDKPALAAWRMPFTVKRATDGTLEVWGAYRPRPAPATLTVMNVGAGATYSRSVNTASQGYFHAFLTGAPTGFSWQVRAANGLTSRVANGTDCN